MKIYNHLCDLGDIVSLISYLVFQRLDAGELVPTNVTVQLIARSVKYPMDEVEDVPLKVGKFVIPDGLEVLRWMRMCMS